MGEQLAEPPSTLALSSTPSTVLSRPADASGHRRRTPDARSEAFARLHSSAATAGDRGEAVDLLKGLRARPRAGSTAAATDRKEVA